ncbi:acyltransferase family protein [Pseudoduganella sp. DS3]|uniref:Acyltransferase family protein n=1 Tax=Pseudoduganella guangdongensis TaxID=2692179 RepID=A0A6N9HKP9_9BURK|nr:acyltransferase family protein [Pseudoduganella guangdongensis]MYN03295.1 acyltransferase family protein [Pseudoduganella guangdongensis]
MDNKRLYFLDWLRICAFFLLVLYHTGMYYVSWDWHVKSPAAGSTIEPLMLLSSPWRMSLLFLIGGAAAAFLLDKLGGKGLAKERSKRLLLPLVFGMFFIVPPQSYFEVVSDVAYQGDYFDFMQLYVTGYDGFCDQNGCLDMPTWNHLWFLPYLWLYTLLLAAVGSRRVQAAGAGLLRHLQGWKLFLLPVAFLALGRILLLPYWPHTHNLTADWHNHALSLPMFLFGAAMARQDGFWQRLAALRFKALGLFCASWAGLMGFYMMGEAFQVAWLPLGRVLYATCQWSGLLAVCAFGYQHLNFDSAARRYLTQAVFPVYLLHQSLIICLAMALRAAGLPPALEGALIVLLTLAISFAVFEMVRRVPLLRPLFGLGKAAGSRAGAKGDLVQNLA